MSTPNEADLKAEWLNTNMKIEITVHGNSIYRNFGLEDGQVPQSAKENLQEIVDTLLDTSEL